MTISSIRDRRDAIDREAGVARSEDGFEDFVRATGATMHRTALLLCGDHHLAEDLTQATYTKVFAAWRRVSAADDPVAYTRTVLTRTFLSHRRLRRTTERPTDDLPEAAGGQVGGQAGGQVSEGDAAVRLDLMDALGRLPARDRTVLVLRYWQDRSVAETAQIMRLDEALVRRRARRALAARPAPAAAAPAADRDG